jgi:hypothetical protein
VTYQEFWLRYLRAHAKPETRAVHYLSTAGALALLAVAIIVGPWWLLIAAPVWGYGCAWIAHFGIEGNRPETFGHPFWSLASDFRMFGLWLAGRLARHLRRAAEAP